MAGIERRKDQINIRFTEKAQIEPERLARFVAGERGAQFTPSGILRFSLKGSAAEQVLDRLQALLLELAGETVAAD